jgi:hypothetical protein
VTWSRSRVMAVVGGLGLAAEGALLLSMARAGTAPSPVFLWGFALSAVLVVVAAIARRHRPGPRLAAWAEPLLAIGLVAGVVALGPAGQRRSSESGPSAPAETATGRYAALVARLEIVAAQMERDAAGALPAGGGALFRALEPWPERWQREAGRDALPLAAGVWRDGQRIAWTAGLAPLPSPAAAQADTGVTLQEHRGAWLARRLEPMSDGQTLELQMALPGPGRAWSGAVAEVVPVSRGLTGGAGVVESESESHGLEVRFRPTTEAPRPVTWPRAHLLVAVLSGWVLAVVLAAWRHGGGAALLASLWVGRAFLAAADLRQAVVASFPGIEYPTSPSSWASLIDPAYFATPVAAGWFASTADAVLTAVLLAVTVRRLRPGARSGRGCRLRRSPWRPRRSSGRWPGTSCRRGARWRCSWPTMPTRD